jgi:hypothetical protein
MIIVKHQTLLETPTGYSKSERKELLRLHTAGLLPVTIECLSSFLSFDGYKLHACEHTDCQVFCTYLRGYGPTAGWKVKQVVKLGFISRQWHITDASGMAQFPTRIVVLNHFAIPSTFSVSPTLAF